MVKFWNGLLCLGLLACVGCGGGTPHYAVTGTVTINGSPGENVLISFAPQDEGGITATGTTDGQGNYKLATLENVGAPAGNYKVKLTRITIPKSRSSDGDVAESSSNSSYEQQAMGNNMSEYKSAEKDAKNNSPIPPKYNEQSTMMETVSSNADNVKNFDIEL